MLTEAQARARAKAVKATFPKGPITVAQAIDMYMAMVDSQVGYASSSALFSTYGKGTGTWQENWNGRQVSWCVMGLGWAFEACFGAKAAIAGIGLQTANRNWPPAGWTATWLWLAWFRDNNRWVGMENCQPGDISLQSWGRTKNEVDHGETVTGYYRKSDDSYPATGFNTATGNASAGAGVQRTRRYRRQTVGIYRPDWEALVQTYNAERIAEGVVDLTEIASSLKALDFPATVDGVRQYQQENKAAPHNLAVDGIPGPKTRAALEADMATLQEVQKAVQEQGAQITALTQALSAHRGVSDEVTLSEGAMSYLFTGRDTWRSNDLTALLANRIGRIDTRVGNILLTLRAQEKVLERLIESQGMSREEVEQIFAEAMSEATLEITFDKDGEV